MSFLLSWFPPSLSYNVLSPFVLSLPIPIPSQPHINQLPSIRQAKKLIGNSLATVNFFLGVVGVIQVGRILSYNYKTKNEGAAAQLEEAKEGVKEDIKGVVDSVEGAVKS